MTVDTKTPAATAGTITEFPIPNGNSGLLDIASGPDGNLWFTGSSGNKIGRITTAGATTEFPIPTASVSPWGITSGPDGNLWFTERSTSAKIGRITPAGVITEFPVPTAGSFSNDIAAGPDGNLWFTEPFNKIGRITPIGVITEFVAAGGPGDITGGSDGNLWFTENTANRIARITTAGVITEFPIPTASSNPAGITAGPDGNLWFTENVANKIARITTAGVITEFLISTGNSRPIDIAAGPNGNLWFAELGPNQIGQITTAGVITEFPGATAGPRSITAGPDGNLWFAELGNKIGRISTSGAVTEFPVPGDPFGIAAGPDGNVWFAEAAGSIGRITTAGVMTEFPNGAAASGGGIVAGPDGNLWFTEGRPNKIGRITTAGAITEFPVPTANSGPSGIAAGPDGDLWFAENQTNKIGRITTAGAITEFPIPTVNSFPGRIGAGPDGNLWFTERSNIGRITTAGVITEFPVPTANSNPIGIAAGPDGNLWFTELSASKIGRITTAGVITEFPVPTVNSFPLGIAAGPDGNLWFTEVAAKIGRITTAGAVTEFPLPTAGTGAGDVTAGPDGNVWFTEATAIGRVNLALPSAPTNVHAVPGDTEATVTWTPPVAGSPITSYTVTASPGGASTIVSALVPAATVSGLTNGTAYTFTVAATNSIGTGPSSAVSNVVTPTAVAQGPSVAVLPAMADQAYGGYLTAAYLQNVSASAANIRVQYFDTSGSSVGFGNSAAGLAAGATWTLRTDNGHSLAATQAGSAVVYSDQPLAVFVNEFAPGNASDATSYTAISVPSGTGSTLYAPAIANNAYGGYTTGIGLINLSTSAVNITVKYRDGSGALIQTQTLPNVAGGAYQGLYSGDAGLGLPPGFAGTATITSSGGNLAAVVNETGPGHQFSSYDAVPAGSTTLLAPAALRNAFGGFNTGTGIQNTTGTPGTVTITYYNGSGGSSVTTHAIAANGYLGIYQGTDIPADGAYTAKITSDVAIAAIVNEVAPPISAPTMSTSYNTFAAGSSSLHLPLVESAGADGWSTGEGIMNTGSAATTVTVTYYDTVTGLTIGTPQSLLLQPNAFWGVYQPARGLPIGARASAVVTTTAGGQVAVICNESNPTSFMSYTAQ